MTGIRKLYLLGHADISTTEIYARADEKMKRKALMEDLKAVCVQLAAAEHIGQLRNDTQLL